MSRLTERFGDQIEFVTLDWDDKSLDETRNHYGITRRTQYALVDVNDEVVQRWFGPLSESVVAEYLQGFLDEQG